MAEHITAGDALAVAQVTNLTPTATNSAVYDVKINGKQPASYTADGSAAVQEIVEGLQAILDNATTQAIPEFAEAVFTEDDTKIIATGLSTGKPFTIADGSGNGTWASITTATAAKSRNHWIAENFSSRTLPASGDTVHVQGLSLSQSLWWGLDQNTITLALLNILADSQAHIGLPEINADGDTPYYEYRDTHLKISADVLRIGDGSGQGSGRIKINTGTNACEQTVYKTGSPADQDEAAVHLAGSHASNTLQVFAGTVDIAMLPGYTAQYATIIASGGVVRCGTGATLATVESAGNALIETRSAVTTLRTRENGRVIHQGAGNITTADVQGGVLKIRATGTLTITTLNGYGGKELDLSECDSAVTITDMNIYATPGQPFTIRDPNNKLTMTNAASTPNGAQSLVVITGSGRNVRIT